jgi:hypothetical protein
MSDLNNTNEIAAVATVLTRAEKYAKTIATLETRIAADTAKLAEVKQEAETAAKLSGVAVNSVVVAKLGRAETTREVLARVVGVKEEDNGSRKFKILFGEGLDTDTVIIQESQIVSVQS